MIIREFKSEDIFSISELFHETIHSVNINDYSEAKLFAWSENSKSLLNKKDILTRQNTLIAQIEKQIAGFGSIDENGYLDFLFVHKDFQRRGIATALCNELEKPFNVIFTHSSVTAKKFFEKRGYDVLNEQKVERAGLFLKRYEMRKQKT